MWNGIMENRFRALSIDDDGRLGNVTVDEQLGFVRNNELYWLWRGFSGVQGARHGNYLESFY